MLTLKKKFLWFKFNQSGQLIPTEIRRQHKVTTGQVTVAKRRKFGGTYVFDTPLM